MIFLALYAGLVSIVAVGSCYFAVAYRDRMEDAERDLERARRREAKITKTLDETQRELSDCKTELAQKKRALDYVCEANRRFAE